MSKTKSKNTTIKKAKKLERQGKYTKALTFCDNYLDNNKIDSTLIQLKIDILVNLYNNENFINGINEYKTKITCFLDTEEEIEFLKVYNTLDNYLELNSQNFSNEKTVGTYLAGGLLVDNLETILVLNEMAKDNYEKDLPKYETIPEELKSFLKNVKKTSYQYLELILKNPKEEIANSNFNTNAIISKIRKYLNPKDNDLNKEKSPSNKVEKTIKEKIEKENTNLNNEKNNSKNEEIKNPIEEKNPSKNETEKSIEEQNSSKNEIEKFIKEKIEKENNFNTENEELKSNSFKLEDNTEITTKYNVEDEIKGLKEIVNYLNEKNEFKKALLYQRRLVKLAREENIKAKHELDSTQKTLNEF